MATVLPYPAAGGTVAAVVQNQLVLPGKDLIMAPFIISSGQTLLAGSVLGAVTATQELVLSASAAGDGSAVPFAILMEDLDTTAGDKTFSVAVEGIFNETALIFGAGHTADTVRVGLRNCGIYLSAPRHSFL